MIPRILLVDDEAGIRFTFTRYLVESGFEVRTADSLAAAEAALHRRRPDAILVDLRLEDGDGLDWAARIRPIEPDAWILVMSGAGDSRLAVRALDAGADGLVVKPVRMDELDRLLRHGAGIAELRRERRERRAAAMTDTWLGRSAPVRRLLARLEGPVRAGVPILLSGEAGVPLAVLARWVGRHGPGAEGSLVTVECDGGPAAVATRLFGGTSPERGALARAVGGTLVLRDVRALDAGNARRLAAALADGTAGGPTGDGPRPRAFHLVATDVEGAPEPAWLPSGSAFLACRFPPLRERRADILPRTRRCLGASPARTTGLSPEAAALLRTCPWPGNDRELDLVVERATLLANGSVVQARHLRGLWPGDVLEPGPRARRG